MIAGIRERFAIEAEVGDCVNGFLLGHIRFWICGHEVGNWKDDVHLRGCLGWLKEFRDRPENRYEPGLWHLPACEVVRLIYESMMHEGEPGVDMQIANAYSRFHISHLGMSSFDRFDLLLIKDEHGAERCLWREGSASEFHECYLDCFEMESVAGEICEQLNKAIGESG